MPSIVFPLRAAFILCCALLAGCATRGTIRGAFEDLTYDGGRTQTGFASYHSTLSLSGLIPAHAPGMLFFEPDALRVGMLPPSLLSAISPRCSFVVESRYAMSNPNTASQAVVAVRDKYLDLRQKSIAVAAARAAVGAAQQGVSLAGKTSDEHLKTILAVLRLTPGDTGEKTAEALKTALVERQEALANAERELQLANTEFTKAVSQPNLLVTRWARESDGGGSATVGTYASGSLDTQNRIEGVLVLGDIRVRSMAIGQDFYDFLYDLAEDHSAAEAAAMLRNVGIVTYAIEAKHVAYISERDYLAAAALSLGLSKEQFAAMLSPQTKIEVAAALSTGANLANTGVISRPVTEVKRFRFSENGNHFRFIEAALLGQLPRETDTGVSRAADAATGEGYATVYTVRATLDYPGVIALRKLRTPRKGGGTEAALAATGTPPLAAGSCSGDRVIRVPTASAQ